MRTVVGLWKTLLHSPEFTGLLMLFALFSFLYPIFAAPDSMQATLLGLFLPWGFIIVLLFLGRERRKIRRFVDQAEEQGDDHA